jgi:hypothetical protein
VIAFDLERRSMAGSYLKDFHVLDPGQVLAGVVTQLANSDSHALMLPHMQPHQPSTPGSQPGPEAVASPRT